MRWIKDGFEYVEKLVQADKEKQFYLFVDEVQMTQTVADTENGNIEITIYDMLNELKAYKNLDVYVTGSNSKGLSSDIATEFRGRATQIHVYPLSFKEYYLFVGGDKRKALDNFMLYGGMPRILTMQDNDGKKAYLSALYDELYMKDIVERNKVEREDIYFGFSCISGGFTDQPDKHCQCAYQYEKRKS